MKRINFMSLVVIALFASSCGDGGSNNSENGKNSGTDENECLIGIGGFQTSFVEAYIDADRIWLSTPVLLTAEHSTHIGISMSGTRGFWYGSTDEYEQAEYKRLAEYFGDTCYNDKVAVLARVVVSDEVHDIDIVSSEDFNGHPAGTSLSDITEITYSTVWPFISSGYEDWGNGIGFHINSMLLSEFPPEAVKMMESDSSLKFTEIPEIKTHTFTVTVTAIDPFAAEGAKGSSAEPLVWSNTAEVTFE